MESRVDLGVRLREPSSGARPPHGRTLHLSRGELFRCQYDGLRARGRAGVVYYTVVIAFRRRGGLVGNWILGLAACATPPAGARRRRRASSRRRRSWPAVRKWASRAQRQCDTSLAPQGTSAEHGSAGEVDEDADAQAGARLLARKVIRRLLATEVLFDPQAVQATTSLPSAAQTVRSRWAGRSSASWAGSELAGSVPWPSARRTAGEASAKAAGM